MADHGAPPAQPPRKKGKLLLLAVPVLFAVTGAGLWFSGILPSLLGHKAKIAETHGERGVASVALPVYVDVPEIVSNLNVPGKRPSFVKMHAKLELSATSDEAAVATAMPRIQDLFQTYLRDMRPEELRGSEGSYRLREELIDRASVAATPARVLDVLFIELIIQ